MAWTSGLTIDGVTNSSNPHPPVTLITGASSGIGRVTARDLAARGHTVVTVSRASGRGAQVADEIRRETGGDVHHLGFDLSLVAESRAMVAAFRERWSRLDALVLNAGVYVGRRRETEEGIELTWALNHLGVFVPAVLLTDLLVASAPARVVVTSSNAAMAGRMRWDDLERQRYDGMGAYAQSKLANQLFTVAFARRLADTGVSVHAMHPGFVATEFGGDAGWLTPLVRWTQRLFGRTPEQGADTLTFLASDPAALASTGGYWIDREQRPMAPVAREGDAAERLWALSEAHAGLTDAELAPLRALAAR
jgi:NAD(P)-dependent dehydrogenase (short-subunit alcohol dehydrogenase family)